MKRFGFSALLAQSETVSKAFGPKLGFTLMVLCILSRPSFAFFLAWVVLEKREAAADVLSRFFS